MLIADDGGDGEEEVVVVDFNEPVDILLCLSPDFVVGALEGCDDDLFEIGRAHV